MRQNHAVARRYPSAWTLVTSAPRSDSSTLLMVTLVYWLEPSRRARRTIPVQLRAAFRVRADFVNSELQRTQPSRRGPARTSKLNGPPRLWKGRRRELRKRTNVRELRSNLGKKKIIAEISFVRRAVQPRAALNERTRATAPRARVRTRSGPQSQVPIHTGGTSTGLMVRDSLQSSGLRARLPRCAAARRGPWKRGGDSLSLDASAYLAWFLRMYSMKAL